MAKLDHEDGDLYCRILENALKREKIIGEKTRDVVGE